MPDIKIFLIGNNSHLEDERMVTKEMGEQLKNNLGFDLFMEASPETGFNTQEIFIQAALLLYNDYIKYKQEEELNVNNEKNNENNLNNNLYEILPEDYPNYDLSFKIIVIGNPGKKQNI